MSLVNPVNFAYPVSSLHNIYAFLDNLQVDVKTIGRAIGVLAGQVEHRGSKKTGGYFLK